MPEGFKKFPIDENEKPFATGAERRVYNHPTQKNKVVAVERASDKRKDWPDKMKEREARADAYLTKIMHILLPDHILDIHFYGSNPIGSVRQRVELGPEHESMREHMDYIHAGKGTYSQESAQKAFDAMNVIKKDPRVAHLLKVFDGFGLSFDDAGVNFGFDKEGNVKYVEPFKAYGDYYREEIKEAIEKITDEKLRAKALRYLDRLDAIIDKEK